MWRGIQPKLKPSWNNFWGSLVAALILGLVFTVYLVAVGIPKTQARNLFNQAMLAYSKGDAVTAYDLLNQAYSTWPEDYIAYQIENPESVPQI